MNNAVIYYTTGDNKKEYFMVTEATAENSMTHIYVELDNGKFEEFDMSLPLQMLFDDVITFISKTDF